MRAFPSLPTAADAPPSLLDGHLWIQEWACGGPLRVQLRESGLLRFGDADRVFDHDDVPPGYRHAVRHVRERFDRDALRAALDDVESAVFYGTATRQQPLDYDWASLPRFLGFDVYHAGDDRLLPPDAVETLYDRLGLTPLPAVAKEVRGADFDPEDYAVPASSWRDGTAAGVLVRNKTGDRALLRADSLTAPEPVAFDADPAALAEQFVTDERVRRAREAASPSGGADETVERVLELLAREEYARLYGDDVPIDRDAFESAAADRARRLLDA
ncbi:uncharacterized protein HHUB_2469 [Halobacterium hubeiense]|uniref:RNA ligase domain-containing protein n=1 Tax=Halobacterium hubeiense TaxID=1407499 RepID=A0A0U5CYF7_9EURY|nr:hypothetical protein [Halobacterium hubeiense]CQH57026.1 uncharacterized protein HHUB_2469 [Halobacterium hubeiense]